VKKIKKSMKKFKMAAKFTKICKIFFPMLLLFFFQFHENSRSFMELKELQIQNGGFIKNFRNFVLFQIIQANLLVFIYSVEEKRKKTSKHLI
jgi:hypothetical protein